MKRYLIYGLGLILIITASAAAFVAFHSSKQRSNNTDTKAVVIKSSKKACDVFTLAKAKKILGGNVKGGLNPIFKSTHDFDLSACSYTQDSGAVLPVSASNTATLLLQAPKTKNGIASNQRQFTALIPAQTTPVNGYGQGAYWDSELGQLNILKDHNWYILSVGPAAPSARTLEQAKYFADIINTKI